MTTSFPVAALHAGPEERTDFDRLVKGPNAYRTISEVADELHVPQHVLRFWETRFPEVKPLKRGGGRRYYSPDDIEVLRRITDLLYVQGYTIKGVQRVLKEQMAEPITPAVSDLSAATPASLPASPSDESTRASFEIPAFQPAEPDRSPPDTHDGEGVFTAAETVPGAMPATTTDEISVADPEFEDSDPGSLAEISIAGDSESAAPHAEGSQNADDDHGTLQAWSEVSTSSQETILDPGEETSAPTVTSGEEEHSTEQTARPGRPAEFSGADEAVVTILQDELTALRADQERWRQERRALRLALEDVLGELDSLREMLPRI